MNKEFYKKLYTVAFRLTGDEQAACELTTNTLFSFCDKIHNSYISLDDFKLMVLKLIKLFVEKHNSNSSGFKQIYNLEDNKQQLQKALLELNPTNRAIIIWKDLLGFKSDEILKVISISKKELYKELNCSYRVLKKHVGNKY